MYYPNGKLKKRLKHLRLWLARLPELTLVSARERSQGMLKKDLFPKYIPHPVKKTTSFPKSHPGTTTIAWLSSAKPIPITPLKLMFEKVHRINKRGLPR
jgi:hypothetical protein